MLPIHPSGQDQRAWQRSPSGRFGVRPQGFPSLSPGTSEVPLRRDRAGEPPSLPAVAPEETGPLTAPKQPSHREEKGRSDKPGQKVICGLCGLILETLEPPQKMASSGLGGILPGKPSRCLPLPAGERQMQYVDPRRGLWGWHDKGPLLTDGKENHRFPAGTRVRERSHD